MGTARAFKYRIECRSNDTKGGMNSNIRGLYVYGSNKNPKSLQEWCEGQEKSELAGGVNHHAALARGFLLSINGAKVIRQVDGEVIQEYKAAPFRLL